MINKRFEKCFLSGKINVSIFSVIAFILLLCADFSVYTLIFFACIAIHELAHIITLQICGGKIKKINVYPFGIDMISDMSTLSYTKELCVVLSGGVSNLMCALIAHLFMGIDYNIPVCFFIYVSLFLGIGNLIPLPVFDGGRALHIVICKCLLPDKAYSVQKIADSIAFFIFFALSIYLFLFTKCNLSAVICIAYSALAAVIYEKLLLKRQF